MDEMLIRINGSTGAISVEETNQGIVSRKNIDADALLNCVRNSIKHSSVSSGLLAQNTISCNIRDDNSKFICLWHPVLTTDIDYYGTVYKDFPLPRLVFGFQISPEGRISSCSLGVVKDERLSPQTEMLVYPFSNVSGFRMCIGNNPMPKCTSPHTLASVPYLLLQLPNNDDWYSNRNNKLGLEYRDLLEHLKDKNSAYYYTDVLHPNQKTLHDFMLQH